MPETDRSASASPAPRLGVDPVLPELREMWWETGVRARAQAGLFDGGPTGDKVRAALPALTALAAATALRAGMATAIGYAQNGLAPKVDREVERGLFEVSTAVRLEAFDADAFADNMERASRGADSTTGLVQAAMNLLAGLAGVVAVAVAVVVVHPLLLVATVPNGWASLRAGHLRYQTYAAGSVRRRRLWLLHRLMAERDSAATNIAIGDVTTAADQDRITAARGFLRDADVLIMDEPSSALDPRAEDALFQAIRDRQGHASTILITHRLANVRHADRIYVLHHGRLVEAGTHPDLMTAGGRYAELFTLQAAGYDTSTPVTTLPRQPSSA
ncbi:hypothetical protein [Micromonospora sp. NPDC051141]|uniref:hypothetical protein n=1 Tax=Micromonospora sp. NPDC051141 TaxID=3364284 RepID=UPI0037B5ACCD